MKKNIFNIMFLGAIVVAAASCSIEPTYYSEIANQDFYVNQNAVWQRFNRPFTHWAYYDGCGDDTYFCLQEQGTDEIVIPSRGSDWYNGGENEHFHEHVYDNAMKSIGNGWTYAHQGVALAWDAMEDIERYVDFDALGFEEGTWESMQAQLWALIARLYEMGLDLFGGCCLYTHTGGEMRPRSTDVETFNFIDSLLTLAIPGLPTKTQLGAQETGTINLATAMGIRARLYFNANAYIGKEMWSECAAICQDIIDGKYGNYALADDWTNIFGWGNENCPEIMWAIPSEYGQREHEGGRWATMQHYTTWRYLGDVGNSNANNGFCLNPSYNVKGEPTGNKLGGVYSKFDDADVRKHIYTYHGDGVYDGMFFVGDMVNPVNESWYANGNREYMGNADPNDPVFGTSDRQGYPITLVDRIGRFAQLNEADFTKYCYMHKDGNIQYTWYPPSVYGTMTIDDLAAEEGVAKAEESSGIRLMKRSPRPTGQDQTMTWDPDTPVMRLTEFYYTLAECKMRLGDKQTAADLINTVRKRYFEGGNDPNPVTAENLDMYRMLDEWQQEFVGECRRRTDLVRWDCYVTEPWWGLEPSYDSHLNRYPIYYNVINGNQLIEQNPGYN